VTKVSFGVCGRFHSFHLAREMHRVSALSEIYAADKCLTSPPGIPREKFHNRLDLAVWQRLGHYIPLFQRDDGAIGRTFDAWLLRSLLRKPPNVLHGWNTHVRQTFGALQGRGWRLCVERSCPHNMFQQELLEEEARSLGMTFPRDSGRLERAIEELYLSDVISTCSTYSASSYTDPVLKAKLRVNPLGGNVAMIPEPIRPVGPLRVLMVGNAFLRKGTHYLIEAFRYIPGPNAELWIRGDVPEKYRRSAKDSRIRFFPPVSSTTLRRLFREASVFCLPSIDDGFGMVVLEALAYGLPVIVTENVGAKDLLNERVSRVVPIRNPRALAEGIEWGRTQCREALFPEAKAILQRNTWATVAERQLRTVYQAE
jgi:glycosyltransferase involved in cell wall biosynthesis